MYWFLPAFTLISIITSPDFNVHCGPFTRGILSSLVAVCECAPWVSWGYGHALFHSLWVGALVVCNFYQVITLFLTSLHFLNVAWNKIILAKILGIYSKVFWNREHRSFWMHQIAINRLCNPMFASVHRIELRSIKGLFCMVFHAW